MKGAVAVVAHDVAVSASSKPRKSLVAVPDSPASPYAPGTLRAATDTERSRVEALVAAHPEFERLGHEPLLQVAASYLDDDDLAARGELRAGGVPVGHWRRRDSDDIGPVMSDELGCCSPSFLLFMVGVVVMGAGFALPRVNTTMEVVSTAFIVIGAGMIGAAFEVGSGEAR